MFAGAAAVAAAAALTACTEDDAQLQVELAAAPGSTVLPGEALAPTLLALSSTLFEAADIAALATEESLTDLLAVSTEAGLPLLLGTDEAVAEELSRLGARTVVTAAGTDLGDLGEDLGDDLEVIELEGEEADDDRLRSVTVAGHPAPVALLVDPELELPAQSAVTAIVQAAGGSVSEIPGGDLGRSGESLETAISAAGDDPATGVVALGESFGPAEAWTDTLQAALTMPQLPGGGHTVFPGRRMIAVYGSPDAPSLGVLGEQGLEETITRVQDLVAEYEGLAEEPLVPAFEIITTMASSDPGGDGDYSSERAPELLREWVDAAGEAGIYVVLDLQPGTTDFLTQAKLYEDLLTEPHVGLALDPEWRLSAGQKHMAQIGSVSAAEVNETVTWLADLTAENALPQKLLILHQFSRSMITDRQDVDTSRPELAITLHADGHGVAGDKLGTWNSLQQDLPEGIFMAWKNFYDEDSPMFTPEQTYEVEPRPWFVSYQ